MPAIALTSLLDIESEVESAFGTYLRTGLGLSATYLSDSNADLPTPRLDCWAVLVEQGTHQHTVATGAQVGRRIYDQNRVRATVNIIYAPETTSAVTASYYRGLTRLLLTDYRGLQADLDTHGFLILAPESLRIIDGDRVIDNDRKEETISATIEAVFYFNPAALAQLS